MVTFRIKKGSVRRQWECVFQIDNRSDLKVWEHGVSALKKEQTLNFYRI